jgi:hypothetical protein
MPTRPDNISSLIFSRRRTAPRRGHTRRSSGPPRSGLPAAAYMACAATLGFSRWAGLLPPRISGRVPGPPRPLHRPPAGGSSTSFPDLHMPAGQSTTAFQSYRRPGYQATGPSPTALAVAILYCPLKVQIVMMRSAHDNDRKYTPRGREVQIVMMRST